MFEILAKFFRFSGKENENKFRLSIAIGLVEALASAMKIPAIMYILSGLLSGESMGKIHRRIDRNHGNCHCDRYYLQKIFDCLCRRKADTMQVHLCG